MAIGSDPTPPSPFRWTKDQYDQMDEIGWFFDKHTELIAGEIIEEGQMTRKHWVGVNLLAEALRQVPRSDYYVTIRSPINMGADSEPRPDAVVCFGRPRDHLEAMPTMAALIVEVADLTLVGDRLRKSSLYARAGVSDYWIVNLRKCGLEVYRNPVVMPHTPFGFGYEKADFFANDGVSLLAIPKVQIAVADLLP